MSADRKVRCELAEPQSSCFVNVCMDDEDRTFMFGLTQLEAEWLHATLGTILANAPKKERKPLTPLEEVILKADTTPKMFKKRGRHADYHKG